MSSCIPWVTMSGDEIETVVAVCLCKQFPDAQRIRPSRGDGGIDVRVDNEDGTIDVYQIKKFAVNLGSSEKRQIIESWRRVKKYCNEQGLRLKNWYLTLPLDPTNENLEWFNENIRSNSDFHCAWRGLTNIEAWTSAMPEVYNYYVANGMETVNQQIKMLLDAAQKPDLRDPNELTKKLFDDAKLLSSIDPNYAYSVRSISKYDKGDLVFFNRPGLVYSTSITNGEGYSVVIEAIAKYKAVAEFAPIKESGIVYADTPEKKQELLNFRQYGTPFTEMPIKNLEGNLRLPLFDEPQDEVLSRIRLLEQIDPHPLSLTLVSGDAHIVLKQRSRTYGQIGAEWTGEDEAHVIHARLRTEVDSLKTTLQITFHFNALSGSEVPSAFNAVNFLYTAAQSKDVELQTMDGEPAYFDPECLGAYLFDQEKIHPWYELLSLLKTIHDAASRDFRCPDFATLKSSQVRRWKEIEHLLNGEQVIRHWDTLKFTKDSNECISFPTGVYGISKLIVPIGDQDVFLGYSQWWLNAASITEPSDTNRECVLHSSVDICDLLVEHRTKVLKREDRDKVSRIFIGPVLDLSAYQQYAVPVQ